MKKILFYLLTFSVITLISGYNFKNKKNDILVFSYTQKYRHKNIEKGVEAIKKIGLQNNYNIVHSENPADFTEENLKKFKALIFLNPTGSDVFNDTQKQAFIKYINNGGGFVGIHAATDFCFEWEWYGKLVGAYFVDHPKVQQATLNILDKKHISTKKLPNPWIHTDEWYNFKDFNKNVDVLIAVDEKSYKGGKMPDFHPISWKHKYDGGKVFYTALGHTEECFADENFLNHLLGGIKYVIK